MNITFLNPASCVKDKEAAKETPNLGSLPRTKGVMNITLESESSTDSMMDDIQVTPSRNRRRRGSGRDLDDELDNRPQV